MARKPSPYNRATTTGGQLRQIRKRGVRPGGPMVCPQEMIVKLLKAGFSRRSISEQLGVSQPTLRGWIDKYRLDLELIGAFTQVKAELLASKQDQILSAMTPAKIETASLRDQATTFNILHNAERLERGNSTANVNLRVLTGEVEDLERMERELMQELAKLKGEVVALPEPDHDLANATSPEQIAEVVEEKEKATRAR